MFSKKRSAKSRTSFPSARQRGKPLRLVIVDDDNEVRLAMMVEVISLDKDSLVVKGDYPDFPPIHITDYRHIR